MAARGWGGSVATAIGVAAGAGAAQLGLGYGLGIIAWLPPSANGTSEAAWLASLTWAAWIAATSTVAGAICAHRLGRTARPSADPTDPAGEPSPTLASGLWRAALAVSSAIGGLLTVVLVAVPARAAVRTDTLSPQTVAAGYAVIGVMIGLLVALWAISSPAVATNVLATIGWLWSLAVIAVVDGVLSGQGLASAQLGVWQLTSDSERFWFRDYFYWPGAALSLGSALLIGMFAARATARRPATRVGAAVSGMTGPLLVAAAYFLAAPRLAGIRAEQVSAHLTAPYAVVAGIAGSALVAALAQRSETLAQRSEALAQHASALARRASAAARRAESEPHRADDSDAEPYHADGSESEPYHADGSGSGQQRAGGSGSAADASWSVPLPVQPLGGSERLDAGRSGPRHSDEPIGAGEDEPTRRERAETWDADGESGRPAGDAPVGATDGPAPSAVPEASDEAKPKGRLGRFGRRSR